MAAGCLFVQLRQQQVELQKQVEGAAVVEHELEGQGEKYLEAVEGVLWALVGPAGPPICRSWGQ